jgi:putative nucleotidyltransferase with HDIG domain
LEESLGYHTTKERKGVTGMSYIPTVEQAEELLKRYNKEAFHIQHAETVSKVLGEFAKEFDSERVDFWRAVGMLHDIDFELYPEQHCAKANEMLRELDLDEELIHAVVSHGYGICYDVEPTKYMEKVLFAVDELTGLIGAAALMRPTGISDMEPKSVIKKFKDKKFAAGCNRDVIRRGAEMLEMELSELIARTIDAMRA